MPLIYALYIKTNVLQHLQAAVAAVLHVLLNSPFWEFNYRRHLYSSPPTRDIKKGHCRDNAKRQGNCGKDELKRKKGKSSLDVEVENERRRKKRREKLLKNSACSIGWV